MIWKTVSKDPFIFDGVTYMQEFVVRITFMSIHKERQERCILDCSFKHVLFLSVPGEMVQFGYSKIFQLA